MTIGVLKTVRFKACRYEVKPSHGHILDAQIGSTRKTKGERFHRRAFGMPQKQKWTVGSSMLLWMEIDKILVRDEAFKA